MNQRDHEALCVIGGMVNCALYLMGVFALGIAWNRAAAGLAVVTAGVTVVSYALYSIRARGPAMVVGLATWAMALAAGAMLFM